MKTVRYEVVAVFQSGAERVLDTFGEHIDAYVYLLAEDFKCFEKFYIRKVWVKS